MEIKTISGIVGFIFMVVGAVIAAEDRYVTQQQAASTINEFRLQVIADQINEIEARERASIASEFDKDRKSRLMLQWEKYNK